MFSSLALFFEGDRPLLQVEGHSMELHHPSRLPRFMTGELRCIQEARRKVLSRPVESSVAFETCPEILRACSQSKTSHVTCFVMHSKESTSELRRLEDKQVVASSVIGEKGAALRLTMVTESA